MMKPTYVIAIAAIILAASFAGIAVMGDDADAADGDEYKVTYAISGSTIVQETSEGKYTFENVTDILGTYKAPTGYAVSGWKDVNSSTVYQVGTEYTFAADVTVEPYLTVTGAVINLEYNDIVYTDAVAETTITLDVADIEAFAKKAGLTYTAPGKGDENNVLKMLSLKGQEFKGFAVEGKEGYITDLGAMKLEASGEITYVAVFEEVHDVAFYFDKDTKLTTLKSNAISVDALPDAPSKTNFTFKGWETAEGAMVFTYDALNDKYVMKEGFEFTDDINLYASFEANGLVVTFVYGEDETFFGTVKVSYGETILPPEAPEGYEWDFDFATPITSSITIKGVATDAPVIDETVNVTFKIEGKDPYTYPVSDRLQVPSTVREGYNFLGWTIEGTDVAMMTTEKVQSDIRTGVYTEDTVFVAVYEIAEPPAPEEPAFYETTTGQVAIVFIVFIVLLFGYGVYSNAFGLRDKLFGYKITKKSKEDKKE